MHASDIKSQNERLIHQRCLCF